MRIDTDQKILDITKKILQRMDSLMGKFDTQSMDEFLYLSKLHGELISLIPVNREEED